MVTARQFARTIAEYEQLGIDDLIVGLAPTSTESLDQLAEAFKEIHQGQLYGPFRAHDVPPSRIPSSVEFLIGGLTTDLRSGLASTYSQGVLVRKRLFRNGDPDKLVGRCNTDRREPEVDSSRPAWNRVDSPDSSAVLVADPNVVPFNGHTAGS